MKTKILSDFRICSSVPLTFRHFLGIPLQQLISSTAQALSSDYKRQTESTAQLNYGENVHTDYSNTYSYGSQQQNQQNPEDFSVSFNGF